MSTVRDRVVMRMECWTECSNEYTAESSCDGDGVLDEVQYNVDSSRTFPGV
jgi:hypothetical protein